MSQGRPCLLGSLLRRTVTPSDSTRKANAFADPAELLMQRGERSGRAAVPAPALPRKRRCRWVAVNDHDFQELVSRSDCGDPNSDSMRLRCLCAAMRTPLRGTSFSHSPFTAAAVPCSACDGRRVCAHARETLSILFLSIIVPRDGANRMHDPTARDTRTSGFESRCFLLLLQHGGDRSPRPVTYLSPAYCLLLRTPPPSLGELYTTLSASCHADIHSFLLEQT